MKNSRFLIMVCSSLLLLSSCVSTQQTIEVQGRPGTQIINPAKNVVLGTIPNTGSLQLTLETKEYHHFLEAKAPNSYTSVPFAMDFSEGSAKMGYTYSTMLTCLGGTAVAEGLLFAALGLGSECILLTVGGVPLTIWGALNISKDKPLFKYNATQQTNNDLIQQ